MKTTDLLIKFAKDLEGIASEWNGDEAGVQEDEAMMALDILKALKEYTDQWGILTNPELEAYNDVMGNRD